MLKAFPPSRYSERIAKLIELSKGRLNDLTAIEFLQRFHRIQYTQLDFAENYEIPLALRDLSIGAAWKRAKLIQDYGLKTQRNFLIT